MKKQTIFSCFLIFCCAGICLYDLFLPKTEGFFLQNMQIIEASLIALYGIVFFSPYTKVAVDWRLHFASGVAIFFLFTSVKYEYDSTFFTVMHSTCYAYLLAVTGWVTLLTFKLSKAQ